MKILSTLILLVISQALVLSQSVDRTVGLMMNSTAAYDGYTLFSPSSNSSVYLINNCGELIHSWDSEYRPGNAVYLQPDGTLWRAGRLENRLINAGGAGGIIEQLNWDSSVKWSYAYSNDTVRAHHDFQVLPNGNVLILAWVVKNKEESLANGRNPELLSEEELWPEQIIEVKPIGTNGGEIVWEWNAWDHMIQDFDETKLNYGVVSDHPEKIDINFIRPGIDGADWQHANSIYYDEQRDQIMLSVLFFDEIWVIDHGTTTEEAKGPKGDLRYRWGNPQSYKQGSPTDQKLFGQHNAYWIQESYPDEGQIMIFNNGKNRSPIEYTSVVKIDPAMDGDNYLLLEDGTYSPANFDWEYTATPSESFYSRFISGAQQLKNGNILITDGAHGRFFEINDSNETVWEYVSPVTIVGIAEQGTNILNPVGEGTNTVFRSTKYATNYQAFVAKDLSPKGILEIDDNNTNPCFITVSLEDELNIQIFPNPAIDKVSLVNYQGPYKLLDLKGLIVSRGSISISKNQIDISDLSNGLYILKLRNMKPLKIFKSN